MTNMAFKYVLYYIASVEYDVDYLRRGTLNLLAANPIVEGNGPEHFYPRNALFGALAATDSWAARLL